MREEIHDDVTNVCFVKNCDWQTERQTDRQTLLKDTSRMKNICSIIKDISIFIELPSDCNIAGREDPIDGPSDDHRDPDPICTFV